METLQKPKPIGPHRKKSVAVDPSFNGRSEIIDSKLLETLTLRHDQFLRFLQQRLGNRDEAEDVLQDFYLRVLLKGGQLRNDNATVAWLRTVLRSALVDHIRKEAKRREIHQQYALECSATSAQHDFAIADEKVVERRACDCFIPLMPLMKAEYAEALSRIDLDQEKREQVACDLGISRTNMRVRLHRARRALRDKLEASCLMCKKRACFAGNDRPASVAGEICADASAD